MDFVDGALRRGQKFTVHRLVKARARSSEYSIRHLVNRNLRFSTSQEVVEALALGCENTCLKRATRQGVEFSPKQLAKINMGGLDSETVRSLYGKYEKELQDGGWVLMHTFSLKTVKDLIARGVLTVSDRFLEQVLTRISSIRRMKLRQHASQLIVWLLDKGHMSFDQRSLERCFYLSRTISRAAERLRLRMIEYLTIRPELRRNLCNLDCWRLVLDKLSLYDLRNLWRALSLPCGLADAARYIRYRNVTKPKQRPAVSDDDRVLY